MYILGMESESSSLEGIFNSIVELAFQMRNRGVQVDPSFSEWARLELLKLQEGDIWKPRLPKSALERVLGDVLGEGY